MVDRDIQLRPEAYPAVAERDNSIDFRRVRNLRVFFEKYAVSLTLDASEIGEWQPGDIVIFEDDRYIAIVSDRRNRRGQPYIIHNSGQLMREEDRLSYGTITGHYRFDAVNLPAAIAAAWEI